MDMQRHYGNMFILGGTNQLQRLPVALERDYIVPDERSFRQLLEYARKLAAEIRYYNMTGQAAGDWRPLFQLLSDSANNGEILPTNKLLSLLDSRQDWPPHVALLLVLIKLYQILQEDLNELPVRHLRHYYENELGLLRRAPIADQVHVVFELAKNASATLLKTGTELDAGKDADGNSLIYKTLNDIVVNSSSIKEIKRLVSEADRRGNTRFFIADEASDLEGDSWYTFGRTQLDLNHDQQFMHEAQLGFAIGSPLLQLAEGTREITLELHLDTQGGLTPAEHNLSFALKLELTGEEGWFEADNFSANIIHHGSDLPTLKIVLTVGETAPAIIAADDKLHTMAPDSKWPMVRCFVRGESGHYDVLNGLYVDHVDISVDVTGVKTLLVQNEEGPLKTDKPMPLFGSQPHIGSVFYIGSEEIFSKRLTDLKIHMEWQDIPADIHEYYYEYFDLHNSILENSFGIKFQIDINMLYARTWNEPLLESKTLFDFLDIKKKTFSIPFEDETFVNYVFGENKYKAVPSLKNIAPYSTSVKYGYIRMLLKGPYFGPPYANEPVYEAFGHKAYPARYAKAALDIGQGSTTAVLPNAPYTPTLASLSLDYEAESTLKPGDTQAIDNFYSIQPFGYYEADSDAKARLVPDIPGQASLFIGLEKIKPPTNISFLFQLDKGTATTSGEPLQRGETLWSYLADKQWQDIPSAGVLLDTTYGFQQPGVISLTIGSDASLDHHIMIKDMLWLRATIDKPADSACRSIEILNQAVIAELDVASNKIDSYDEHLQTLLAAESISKLKKRVAAIKKVSQPYASFGGQGMEPDTDFFQSSSERLRHRNRAVTVWDMERLVLNKFPQVFKVKCLPHSDSEGQKKAGELALVIIPDLRSGTSTNPLEPRADSILMRRIDDYISQIDTPFSSINVIHPVYENIMVDAEIAFREGIDPGYYSAVLNEELRRFLSPWAYEEGQDILFGTRIYKSEILAFIEDREYVDYITNFNLFHSYDGPRRGGISDMVIDYDFIVHPLPIPGISAMEVGEDFVVGRGVEVAETSLPHAIHVSNSEHRITSIDANDDKCTGVDQLGIGYMSVGLDFYVHPE